MPNPQLERQLAADRVLGHYEVAIKLLPPDLTRDDAAKQQFLQEAQAASALDHPNICTIYEIDETPEGQMFIAMGVRGLWNRVDQVRYSVGGYRKVGA